jgi:hypothetical protein
MIIKQWSIRWYMLSYYRRKSNMEYIETNLKVADGAGVCRTRVMVANSSTRCLKEYELVIIILEKLSKARYQQAPLSIKEKFRQDSQPSFLVTAISNSFEPNLKNRIMK